jgi:hypothetical protein
MTYDTISLISTLSPFQIIICFGFSRHIAFIYYVVSRKAKTSFFRKTENQLSKENKVLLQEERAGGGNGVQETKTGDKENKPD